MLLFFFLSRGLYMYCSHGNKLMETTTASTPQLSFLHGYIPEISSISITKIEDWVLLGITEKNLSDKKSQCRGLMVQFLASPMFHKTLFTVCITPKAKDLNNTQQDAPRIQKRSQTYGRVGVSDTYIWHILRNNSIGKQKK